jgi:hypothetical protein
MDRKHRTPLFALFGNPISLYYFDNSGTVTFYYSFVIIMKAPLLRTQLKMKPLRVEKLRRCHPCLPRESLRCEAWEVWEIPLEIGHLSNSFFIDSQWEVKKKKR